MNETLDGTVGRFESAIAASRASERKLSLQSTFQRRLAAIGLVAILGITSVPAKQMKPALAVTPADWPTYLADAARSGQNASTIQTPLTLVWQINLPHEPLPSWPPPALRDPYNGKDRLDPRVIFDRASHVVGTSESRPSGGRIYYSTSSDGRVVCRRLTDGGKVWSYTTEGPVRCAPTLVGDLVIVGSDDGCVYAFDRMSGQLEWKTRIAPADQRLPGNQRMISRWPIRTGVTHWGDRCYVAAGLFPVEGVYYAALDPTSGELLQRVQIDRPLQGYPKLKNGKLVVPTGRDGRGAALDLQLSGDITTPAGPTASSESTAQQFPFSIVGTSNYRFGGSVDRVAAVELQTGDVVWSAHVEGKPYGLAIVGPNLLVSTDRGKIYCFRDATKDRGEPVVVGDAASTRPPTSRVETTYDTGIRSIISQMAPSTRGYVLLVGTQTGQTAIQLAQDTQFTIIGVEADEEVAIKARRQVEAASLAHRISIHAIPHERWKALPYVPQCFNAALIDAHAALPSDFSMGQLRHLVSPYKGLVANLAHPDSAWRSTPDDGAGEWSHTYADGGASGSSQDRLLTSDIIMQWYGPPGPHRMVDRHQRNTPPLFVSGRMFVPGDNYLYAVDAFNGTILWERQVPEMTRLAVLKSSGNMAANGKNVFVASGRSCFAFNAESGVPDWHHDVAENDCDWGYVAISNDYLIGSETIRGSQRWPVDKDSWKIAYEDQHRVIVSSALFAYRGSDSGPEWRYTPDADRAILNPTICHDGSALYWIECPAPSAESEPTGRPRLSDVFRTENDLCSVDIQTGQLTLRGSVDLSALQHVIHMSVVDDTVVVSGSKNVVDPGDPNRKQLFYELRAYEAASGRLRWSREHLAARQVVGGVHGEQMQRPVIVDKQRVHLETTAYRLEDGAVLWTAPRPLHGGCGTISCSSRLGFRRVNSTPHSFDLVTGESRAVTTTTRPGCWINMLPVGGLLLVPEASSGCSCNHGIQTSFAMRNRIDLPETRLSEGTR